MDIAINLNGVNIGNAAGVALTGVNVTVDSTALTLDGIELTIAANTPIALSQAFGGYDNINIESATIQGDSAFSTVLNSGSSSNYNATAGPLVVTGSWGASDSTGVNAVTAGNPISFPVVSIIAIVSADPLLEINSVTINSIDGTPFGEVGEHLTIVASYFVAVPEPGTGALVAFGLGVLAWRRRQIA